LLGAFGKEEKGMIRDLKRTYGSVAVSAWPPIWTSAYDSGRISRTGQEGVLESVERLGNRLTLRVRFGEKEQIGSLLWDEPPTIAEVEAVLKTHLGEPIQSVSDLQV
jgi:hypothetical protein